MALRFNSFLVPAAVLPFAFVATVACSSDESNSNEDSSANGPSTASNTATNTATQTSAAAGSTTVTNTAAVTTASVNTATNTRTSTSSTTATSGGASTTGNATTGDGGSTSTDTSSSTAGGGAGGTSSATSTTGGGDEFALTSPAFADDGVCSNDTPDTCELFPSANSSFVDNENPELNWGAGPEGTLSYALVFHDTSNGFGHWAIWGLAGDVRQIPAALPGDATLTTPIMAQQVNASFAEGNGYFGPGSCENVYEFKLYALNVEDYTPQNAGSPDMIQDELEGASADIVVEAVTLRGRANPEDSTQPCN